MRVPARKGRFTGVNSQAASLEPGKIERSAEALRVHHHPLSLPPTVNPFTRPPGNWTDKKIGSGKE
jgi:hypothetical protein